MLPYLAKLKDQITRLTCDCDKAWIRQQLQAMQQESHDPIYRAQIAEILRFGCSADNVIRGYQGHFAGCAGGGSQAVHTQEIHTRGGMKAEIELRMHERDAKNFVTRNGEKGAARYKALHDALTQQAKEGAAKLTAKDKAVLKADLNRTIAKAAELESKGRDASHYRDEALMIQRQLDRARTSVKETGAKATPAKVGKSSSLLPPKLTPVIAKDEVVIDPQTGHAYSTNPFGFPDIQYIRTLYGDQGMRDSLANNTTAKLREAYNHYAGAKGGAKKSSESTAAYRDRLIDTLVTKAKALPLYDVGKRADHPYLNSKVHSQRATDPDADTLRLRIQIARMKA